VSGITEKEAERLVTIEEWCRNHENHHSNKQIITIALIRGVGVGIGVEVGRGVGKKIGVGVGKFARIPCTR